MDQLQTYWPLFPEMLLALGAMALLMIGAFRPERDATAEAIGWLSILTLAMAGWLILQQPAGVHRLFDGAFVVDGFARFMKVLTLVASAAALILSFDDMRRTRTLTFEYPVLVLLATAGMLMMISANDLIALYLGLELQSLALYVMAAIRRDDLRSSEAGLKYFVLGALSSGMLLYGASLVYGFTGSTNFAVIASAAAQPGAGQNLGLIIGLVFLLVGLAFKISAVPFHMWTPDVYEGAPTPVAAFFSAGPKVAAMALLMRVTLAGFAGTKPQWQQIITALAIASMLLGAFAAIGQSNIKRLLAYSAIGNIGYALIGLAAGSPEGARGVVIYLVIYVAMTLGAFACVLAMRRGQTATEEIDELSGLAQNNLALATLLAILLFSLAGIPPLAGFFAKFYVFLAAVREDLWPLAVIGVLASVVSAYYYVRIVKIMFFDQPRERFAAVQPKAGLVMGVAGVSVLLYVIWPAPLVDAAGAAVKSLF
ncbi:MAG TPA: NADH-quinone oxidoreductase subunit NuoN [Hyphomicrobiaceae bacterium]|jgi:NADH-quinone oxidoreductase subunit N|nr:NADH-quinone oxidoreductase subunit NuoN [Hyphomicrobiaceae bacterium]